MSGGKSFNLRRAMTLLASLRIKIASPKPGEALMSDVRKGSQPDSSTRQVRTFRDLFLITELLDSKAESDDVGF